MALDHPRAGTTGHRASRAATTGRVAAALVLASGAVLACTPPRPFDVELTVAATVEGAGALLPGSRGRLVFTAWHPNSRRRGPERFEVHQPAVSPQEPAGAPIRLRAVPNSECAVEDRFRSNHLSRQVQFEQRISALGVGAAEQRLHRAQRM